MIWSVRTTYILTIKFKILLLVFFIDYHRLRDDKYFEITLKIVSSIFNINNILKECKVLLSL